MQDWRNMLKHAQELRLKLRNQRTARCSAPGMAEERQEESCETLREKREALRQRRIRTSDIASLAQIERELYEVEEQLVSKKIAERLPVGNPRRLEQLLTALNLQAAPPTRCDAVESGTEQKPGQNVTEKKKRSSDRLNIYFFSIESNLFSSNQFAP